MIADVLIIGAGASGGVAARALQQAGFAVVALEQGEWHDRVDFPGMGLNWELDAGQRWSPDPMVRRAAADYPLDLSDSDMRVLNFNGVGGGTILYNAIWPRFLPGNFRNRSLYGIADDWPLDYAELLPYYEETDREIGIAGMAGDPAYPPQGAGPPLPPHPLSKGHLAIARALHARGWHWWPGPNAVLSTPYDGRHPCVQRGTCVSGCNEGAKSSIDQTHWRRFTERGGKLITGARAGRITLDDAGLANGAIWFDGAGAAHFQPARIVLCAANGIGTPRLLLASACERFPTGLANRSDQLGRNLMMHPLATVTGYFTEMLQSWQGLNGSSLISLQFALDDAARGFRGGAKWSLQPMSGGPALESFRLLARGIDPAAYHETFEKRFGHNLMWSIMCEDMPDPENRVTLSPALKDGLGLPAPKLTYRISTDARKCLDFNCAQAASIFREAGAWSTESYNPAPYNAHFMGTARMGDDPARSVVNRWGLSHDIPNLGIIDGSVFVTSAAVNPTTTICALALRTARHIIDHRHNIPVPSGTLARHYDLKPASPAPAQRSEYKQPLLNARQRTCLAAWGDALIPPTGGLSGAGTVLIEPAMFKRIGEARPDLAESLSWAAETYGELTASALREADVQSWLAVLTAISAAYTLHPNVRRHIGYDGQIPRPVTPDRYPDYVAEGLLDHLLGDRWAANERPTRSIDDAG